MATGDLIVLKKNDLGEWDEHIISPLTAFNKNFGTTEGTVAEGNHGHIIADINELSTELGKPRIPIDGSVTYGKVSSQLKGRSADSDGTIDFSATGLVDLVMSTSKTLSFQNTQQNKTLKVKVVKSGGAQLSLPSSCIVLDGSADYTPDGTYYFYFDAWSTGEILVSVGQSQS